ncbi:MAG TPA: YwqG family protein, partial [Flavilitoribacter sp.]|nr:YwqG family protein [Flavilitoribacter sp.]
EIFEWYAHEVSSEGHKVGGYAHFAQQDPRRAEDNLVLLFQMDTDAEMECMWGDMGTAKFFISEQDLKDLNFSRVMYYWDCF